MKKQQNNSIRAWALQVALSVALLSISAVLLASSFKAAPATRGLSAPINLGAAGDNDLVIAGQASFQSLFPADAPFTFGNTGSLTTARYGHTATLLSNGKVLVAGGNDGVNLLNSAELYDPASGTWSGPRAALPPDATVTRRRCCLTARCWWQGDITASFLAARNCTTLPAGLGVSPATSPPYTTITRRRCCPTARCWWQGDQITPSARNCTTLPAGCGLPRAASTPDASFTRRHCCPTARCWWPRDLTTAILTARNCTTLPAGCGLPRATSVPGATLPRRRCCPTARCWWPQERVPAASFLAARNCTTRPAGLDCHHGQPQHRTLRSQGDVAAQRPGAGGRRI